MLKNLEPHKKIITPGSGLAFVDTELSTDKSSTPAKYEAELPQGDAAIKTKTNSKVPARADAKRADAQLDARSEPSSQPKRETPILSRPQTARTLKAALAAPRLAIEKVSPAVDDGCFPVKRSVGDNVRVEADVFMDGHDRISVALLWRTYDVDEWNEVRMRALGNDRWTASFPLERIGRHLFTIEAWRDTWSTLSNELSKKFAARQDVSLDVAEARNYIEQVAAQVEPHPAELDTLLQELAAAIEADAKNAQNANVSASAVALLVSERTAATLAASDRRAFVLRLDTKFAVDADRPIASFASWYELFPRSQGALSEDHHGTFDDVIMRLPAIRDMGFDVLYFPPIHPIGKSNRKGRNNNLIAAENDLGSPYAIGSAEGGHDAIHPQLGNFDDFARLIKASAEHGLEIALDFAIQCSPDHPWLREHPEWFQWRADGSVRHAENPPKKYEDIVNVDFYAPDGANGPVAPALWLALRDIVLFWVGHGIRIFRVDNPHTKPLSFWQWMIAEVRGRNPDVIFLAEAFTRPKVMARLAKIGYTQSYTYFTWRESKWELTQYLEDLNAQPLREFFRPHFFVNTPDINPRFLQRSGRAGFVIRAALAGFLSGLWGMYSGFELCEAAAAQDGDHSKEEYADSEKYQIKVRSWQQPGNIVGEIALINRIRRNAPALHSHLGLKFHRADNEQVLFFTKTLSAAHDDSIVEDIVLVAINLDPFNVQESYAEFPLYAWGYADDAEFAVEDLVSGNRWVARGKHQTLRLDPGVLPFLVWRITPGQITQNITGT